MSMTSNKAFYSSRWFLVVLAVVVVPFIAVGVYLMMPSALKPGISQENFHRIRPGMTEEEVEAIIGKREMPIEPVFIEADGSYILTWKHGYRRISMFFNKDKRVKNGTFSYNESIDPRNDQTEFLVPLR